jgi:transcriptional regulator GlxA family with amidase domain
MMTMNNDGKRLGIYIFDGAEVLDWAGPISIVDSGRVITGGGISSGIEMGFYLLERFGYDEKFVDNVAYIMEYEKQWKLMKSDRFVDKS